MRVIGRGPKTREQRACTQTRQPTRQGAGARRFRELGASCTEVLKIRTGVCGALVNFGSSGYTL
jgi:hypothetical protein